MKNFLYSYIPWHWEAHFTVAVQPSKKHYKPIIHNMLILSLELLTTDIRFRGPAVLLE